VPTSLIELFQALDDPVHLEFPADFAHTLEQHRFVQLVVALQAAFDCKCAHEAGLQIQDASYLGTIEIPAEATALGTPIHVRISNFGGLALLCPERPGRYGDDEARELISGEDRDRVEGALKDQGYLPVPEDILWTRYDSPAIAVRAQLPAPLAGEWRPSTWFDRFFDVL
jgi:hypothetical protein